MEAPLDDPAVPSDTIAPGVRVAPGGMRLHYARSGGPGGQNVNKLSTKAELWVQVSAIRGLTGRAIDRLRTLAGARLTAGDEIHLRAESERSQQANRLEVFKRLRELIVQARVEPKVRRKTKPSRAAKKKRLESKRHRSQIKTHRRGVGRED
jgi:ribosome-associated protein